MEKGELVEHFPVPVWQTGSGTGLNMNANEVLANLASEMAGAPRGKRFPVHPNDHVNRSQSSNDVIPTAIHVAVARAVTDHLDPALRCLVEAFAERRADFGDVVKTGRTHLMDAVPLTFGQEISGWESQVEQSRRRILGALDEVYALPLGGSAVGTGLNVPEGFAGQAIALLAERTGLPFRPAENRFAAQGGHDALVALSGALKGLAVALIKIAGDIRLLASGPRCGLGELRLPANEPGSSIMPGKVNPTQAEALHMVCALVIGHDAAITLGRAVRAPAAQHQQTPAGPLPAAAGAPAGGWVPVIHRPLRGRHAAGSGGGGRASGRLAHAGHRLGAAHRLRPGGGGGPPGPGPGPQTAGSGAGTSAPDRAGVRSS